MNDCCNHDCDQGRDRPNRTPSPIQPETYLAWIFFVIFAFGTYSVIVWM